MFSTKAIVRYTQDYLWQLYITLHYNDARGTSIQYQYLIRVLSRSTALCKLHIFCALYTQRNMRVRVSIYKNTELHKIARPSVSGRRLLHLDTYYDNTV